MVYDKGEIQMKYNITFSHPDYKKYTTHPYTGIYWYYYRMSKAEELRDAVMDYIRGEWYDYGKA